VYVPDQDGQFNLELEGNLTAYTSTLVVEGPTASGLSISTGFPSAARLGGQSFSSTPSLASAAGHGVPILQSVVEAPTSLIKITKAKMSITRKGGKPDFQCVEQMCVELNDSTANISQVCESVRGQWGPDYTVVSTEGIEIEDSLATQC